MSLMCISTRRTPCHVEAWASKVDAALSEDHCSPAVVAVTGSSVGMDHQSPESEQDVINYVVQLHADYPVAYDGSLEVAKQYLQGGFPTLVVIDKNKKITYLSSGETSFAELDTAIKHALTS